MKLLYATFFVIGFSGLTFSSPAFAEASAQPLSQASGLECIADADCTCRLSPDHCGMLPQRVNGAGTKNAPLSQTARAKTGLSKTRLANTKLEKSEKEHPACFGPHRYVIPKCQLKQCICQDNGKAPD